MSDLLSLIEEDSRCLNFLSLVTKKAFKWLVLTVLAVSLQLFFRQSRWRKSDFNSAILHFSFGPEALVHVAILCDKATQKTLTFIIVAFEKRTTGTDSDAHAVRLSQGVPFPNVLKIGWLGQGLPGHNLSYPSPFLLKE